MPGSWIDGRLLADLLLGLGSVASRSSPIVDMGFFAACWVLAFAVIFARIRGGVLPSRPLTRWFVVFLLLCGADHMVNGLSFGTPVHRLAVGLKVGLILVSWSVVIAICRQLLRAMPLGPPSEGDSGQNTAGIAKRFALEARDHEQRIWDWDVVTDATDCSTRFFELLGRHESTATATGSASAAWIACLHPADRDRAMAAIAAYFERRLPLDIEYRLQTQEGSYRWFHARGHAAWDGNDRPARLVGSISDITEQKRAEEALQRSEERYALALRGTNEGVWDWDIASDLVNYSPRVAEILGRSGGGFTSAAANWRERVHPDDVEHSYAALADHLERQVVYDIEFRLRLDDGRYRWFHSRGQAIWDADGHATRMVGSIGDISDRKQTEHQLRLLQAAVEHANDVILITEAEPIDQPGPRVVYVNAAFERITGYTSGEIIGRTPRILQGPATDRATLDHLRSRLKRWKPVRVELLNYTKDDQQFWVELNIRPVANAEGRFTHWISIQRDITSRKLADQERRVRDECQLQDLNLQLQQRVNRLDALRQIDMAISGSLDLGLTLGIVLDQVRAQVRVDGAAILLLNDADRTLCHAASKGFRTDGIVASRLRLGEGYASRAILEDTPILIPDFTQAEVPFARTHLLNGEGFVSYLAVPLVAKGIPRGVLEIYQRSPLNLNQDSMAFFQILAGQAAIAIENATLIRDLQRSNMDLITTYDATIEGWARALDLRDKETEGHTRRVTEMTDELARFMGIRESDLLAIRRGALLHDIGKLGIPDSILLKPGKLTDHEWQIMRRHPEYAFEWLAPIEILRPALDIPYCHHEKWDGSGYPRGLVGSQIPLAARIFAVVDIWDALRSDRPYRSGWPEDQVLAHIRSLAGTHLDPTVVAAFLQLHSMEMVPCPCVASPLTIPAGNRALLVPH